MAASFGSKWAMAALVLLGAACSVYVPELVDNAPQGGSGGDGGSTAGKASAGSSAGGKAGDTASGGTDAGNAGSAGTAGSAGSGGSQSVISDPYLTGELKTPPVTVVLSSEGKSDWVHWGLKGPTDSNHKADVASQLLALDPFGSTMPVAYSSGPIAFSWNDGTPTAAATTHAGIAWEGEGEGFVLTIPAVTEERRARLYVGVKGGTAQLSATLSDGEVAPFEETWSSDDESWLLRLVTLEYGWVTAADAKLVISLHVEPGALPEAALNLSALSIAVK